LGDAKTVTLRSLKSNPKTQISVLGQSDQIVEYRPTVKPKTTWSQDEAGLHITAYRAQRLYTDRGWPNPIVLKIVNADQALTPPEVTTSNATWNAARHAETLSGSLAHLGGVQEVQAGFQYRVKKDGMDLSEKIEPWIDLPLAVRTATGDFSYELENLGADREYEYRAVVRHPLLTTYGQEKTFRTASK
jgi:alpha-L-fucosidase